MQTSIHVRWKYTHLTWAGPGLGTAHVRCVDFLCACMDFTIFVYNIYIIYIYIYIYIYIHVYQGYRANGFR